MKIRSIFTVLVLLALAITGCNDQDDSRQSKNDQSAEVNRLNRELQETKTNVSKEESAKAWWQNVATVVAIAAIALLIVGIVIGSAARHESER